MVGHTRTGGLIMIRKVNYSILCFLMILMVPQDPHPNLDARAFLNMFESFFQNCWDGLWLVGSGVSPGFLFFPRWSKPSYILNGFRDFLLLPHALDVRKKWGIVLDRWCEGVFGLPFGSNFGGRMASSTSLEDGMEIRNSTICCWTARIGEPIHLVIGLTVVSHVHDIPWLFCGLLRFMLDVENKDWSDVDLNWGVPRWNMSAQLVEAWSSVGVWWICQW